MSFPAYSEYKDSGVEWLGAVPKHWHVTLLKRGYEVVLGKMLQPDAKKEEDELLPYLRAANIQPLGVDTSDVKNMWFSTEEKKSLLLRRGDLLVSEGGDVGRSALWNSDAECYFQNSINRIRSISGNSTTFLYFWMNLIKNNGYVDVLCNKSTIAHFTAEKVSSVPLVIPNIEEQTQIARFLDHETTRIDALIKEQQRLIGLLKEKRQAVISHAVTKGLNPNAPMKDSGVEWLGEVPAHWRVGTLSRVADRVVVGIAEAATHAYADTGVPILRATNIRPGKIIGETLYINKEFASGLGSKLMRAGDLVTVRTGNAGVTAVVPEQLDGCQCFTMLITSLKKCADSEYFNFLLNSSYAKTYFSLEGWGTAQINISVPILKQIPIPIPPHAEQSEIAEYLQDEVIRIDSLIGQADEISSFLIERRSALISSAVTGKIDVRGWQPPESAATAEATQGAN